MASLQWCDHCWARKKFSQHMFWTTIFQSLFPVKTTQRTKTTLGGREGGLLSERQTRALAAHMNGIRGDPLTQLHCQWLPMATGTRGEPDASCDVGAGYPLVAQDGDLNDQRRIPLGWAFWGHGSAAQAKTCTAKTPLNSEPENCQGTVEVTASELR